MIYFMERWAWQNYIFSEKAYTVRECERKAVAASESLVDMVRPNENGFSEAETANGTSLETTATATMLGILYKYVVYSNYVRECVAGSERYIGQD